ncbi:MAG TPA: potassium transporter Kup [Anaeromyxobacteraceae bacterium]|nr:potassium transporter Kup [Anaeromyxobacteraceae bacterium]
MSLPDSSAAGAAREAAREADATPVDPAEPSAPIQRRAELPAVGVAPPPPEPGATGHGHRHAPTGKALAGLALGALGVVYGDIGTSPLYALKECFNGPHGVEPSRAAILGVLSLVFWAMTFVVTFKYLSFVMRADNRGEGGILALQALVSRQDTDKRSRQALLVMGIFGAALLYGDGVITPAISVLSAVEGVAVAAPALGRVVVPLTVLILAGLFVIQRSGTARVGAVFGPVMLVWFLVIGALGARGVLVDPSVLAAVSPLHAVRFFAEHGVHGFLVLGAVVLCITGGEALYADMGHFGKRPIRLAWLGLAMPALVLNYFGQGAVLLHDPSARENPFYLLAPEWALYPLIAVATAATIVASQALISGAFSLTHQAVQLGYSPRVTVKHTSHTEIGQIYVPEVNWAIGVACIALVLGFKSSSNLAAAYGIAVTGTMSITTLLFHRVMRDLWRWPRWQAWPLTVLFLAADLSFFGANLVKIEEGGWFPIAAAVLVFTLMSTWKRGRAALAQLLRDAGLPLDLFLEDVARRKPTRIPGTAVFMTSNLGSAPPVLLHHLKHNKVLHERILFVSVLAEEIPAVPEPERVVTRELGDGFFQVVAHYGFMEQPNVPALLEGLRDREGIGPRLDVKPMDTTFYLGRETLLATGTSKLATWRKRLFIVMSRNAATASAFFGLPPNRVVELGAQVQL